MPCCQGDSAAPTGRIQPGAVRCWFRLEGVASLSDSTNHLHLSPASCQGASKTGGNRSTWQHPLLCRGYGGKTGEKRCTEQQSTLLARGPEHPPAGNPAAFTQKHVNTCKYSFFSLLLALSDPFWRAPEGRSSRARPTPPIASPTPQPSTFHGTQMGQKALEQPKKKKHSTHRSCSTRSWEQAGLCPSRDKLIVAGANRVLGAAPPEAASG